MRKRNGTMLVVSRKLNLLFLNMNKTDLKKSKHLPTKTWTGGGGLFLDCCIRCEKKMPLCLIQHMVQTSEMISDCVYCSVTIERGLYRTA